MDQKICETPITGDFLAKHLKHALGPRAILKSVEAKRVAEGQGYASNILRVQLTWEKEDNLPKSVIVKAPNVESLVKLLEAIPQNADDAEKLQAVMAQAVPLVHNAECDFYNLFGKVPPIPIANCYVAVPVTDQAPGMIVLEDLSDKAGVCPLLLDGLNYDQVMEAISAIARLHAWSLKTSIDWRNRIPSLKDREHMLRGFMASAPVGFQVAKEKYPEEFAATTVEKMVELSSYEAFEGIMNEHLEFMEDVLCHGDFHINNIMYRKEKDGRVGDRLAAVIDFQALMKGCPMYDVAHFFGFSVSHKLRRKHKEDFLRRYYDEVKLIAGDKFPATLDQIRRLFDRQFAIAAILMVSWIPTLQLVMVKSEGEQKEKDQKRVVELIKAGFDDALAVFGV